MHSSKLLFLNSFFYSFSGILSKCIGFILIPIYTHYLTPEDYGIVNYLLSFIGACNYFILLSLDSGLMRYFVKYENEPDKLRRLYGSLLGVVFISYCLFLIIILLLINWLEEKIFNGIAFFPYILICLLILGAGSMFTMHRRYLEASQKGKKLFSISIFGTLLSAGTAVSLIAFLHLGAKGMLLATLISDGFYLCYMVFDIISKKMAIICLDWGLIKESLTYSIPIIPHNASGYICHFLSRFFLKITDSLATLGIFSFALQIASAIETIQDGVGHAYRPWLNSILSDKNINVKEKIANTSKILICGYSFLYVFTGLFAMEIVSIMAARSFFPAWKIVVAMTMVYSFYSIYYFYIYYAFYYKETTRKIFYISMLGNIVTILTIYFTVQYISFWGNILGMFASINIRWVGIYFLLRKKEKIGYDIPFFMLCILISWAFIAIGNGPALLTKSECMTLGNILFKILILMIYSFIIYFIMKKNISNEINILSSVRSILRKEKIK